MPSEGPLPPGRYYIFGRGTGGLIAHIRDWALAELNYGDRRTWFALYRDDGRIDDITFVDGVRRGAFRLHPEGHYRVSKGCLTLQNQADFDKLAAHLHLQGPSLPTSVGMAYGVIEVR